MMPAADYDATSLRKAIKVGDGCSFVNKIVWHINSCVVTVLQLHVPEIHTCTASSCNTFMMISQKIDTDNGLICLMNYVHKREIVPCHRKYSQSQYRKTAFYSTLLLYRVMSEPQIFFCFHFEVETHSRKWNLNSRTLLGNQFIASVMTSARISGCPFAFYSQSLMMVIWTSAEIH